MSCYMLFHSTICLIHAIFRAQDKARLTADIRQFATKISRDFEEKEQLSVESNLWKSKFLACSVIIDELARSKASLQVTHPVTSSATNEITTG